MLEKLQHFITAQTGSDHHTAVRGTQLLTRSDLEQRRDAWVAIIADIDANAILLHQHCGFEQLALLLAIWQQQKIAVLPASVHPSHLRTILGDAALAELHNNTEFAVGINIAIRRKDTALVVYTSGSSGDAKPVEKSFAQLNAELALLESCWGDAEQDNLYISAVSRHHMFGLPFALLWPLVRGNPFLCESIRFMESLESHCDRPFTLAASPVQLANLPPQLDWKPLSEQCTRIFCAGAPLLPTAAKHTKKCFAKAAIEIYGSTETGVIALRQQLSNPHWQSLPGIKIRLNESDNLQINSPLAGIAKDEWYTLSDVAEVVDDNRFSLLGRSDQIVKIGGKRLSLTQTNRELEQHPWVAESCCLLIPERRDRIGAIVTLNAEGRRQLIDCGRLAINRELTQFLNQRVEPLGRPRLWRYIKALPKNAQGKLAMDTLRDFFVPDRQPRLPELLGGEHDIEAGTGEWQLFIPHQLYYFDGHFPGNAVLPGVVQISWAIHFATTQLGINSSFQRLEVVKFQQVIQAGETITLSLSWRADTGKLTFSYRGKDSQGLDRAFSSGRIGLLHD